MLDKGLQLIKQKNILLGLLAIFFLIGYSWLYVSTPDIFNSPDETAGFVFIEHFIEQGDLTIEMPENPENVIRPRSVNIVEDNYVPGSFIGMIVLFGYVGRLFGIWIVQLLPALIAVLGVLAHFGIIRRVFDERIAFLSSILLFFIPQWWHYASRGFLPNVSFISLLLITGYCLIRLNEIRPIWRRVLISMFLGLSMGAALVIRPSEFWWVIGIAVVGSILYREAIRWRYVLISLIPFMLIVSLIAYWQIQIYGGLLTTGYQQFGDGQAGIGLWQTIFPFGFDFFFAIKNFLLVSLKLFWWQTAFVIIGLIAWLKSADKSKSAIVFVTLWITVSLYLIFYYGSWEISDDIDPTRFSIGTSYVRYWLFISLGSLPFLADGLMIMAKWLKKLKMSLFWPFFGLFLGICVVYSYGYGDDHLPAIQNNIEEYATIREQIEAATPPDSVIISERSDKVFWPSRPVIHFQDQNFDFVAKLPAVVDLYPVYWFTPLPSDHVEIWEQTVFRAEGLGLEFVDGLYQIKLTQ